MTKSNLRKKWTLTFLKMTKNENEYEDKWWKKWMMIWIKIGKMMTWHFFEWHFKYMHKWHQYKIIWMKD